MTPPTKFKLYSTEKKTGEKGEKKVEEKSPHGGTRTIALWFTRPLQRLLKHVSVSLSAFIAIAHVRFRAEYEELFPTKWTNQIAPFRICILYAVMLVHL